MGVDHDFTQESDWYEAYECRHCQGLLTLNEFRGNGGTCPKCGHISLDWARLCDAEHVSARKIAFYKNVTRLFFWNIAKLVKVETQVRRYESKASVDFDFWDMQRIARANKVARQADQTEAN